MLSFNDSPPVHFYQTAFTRAITLLYALTLLTLLTHIQLNLLGTRKYVQSVRRLVREQQNAHSSSSKLGALFFPELDAGLEGEGDGEDGEDGEGEVTDETERKFLTLSWWLLNVGWKDVADRVRAAVEGVFAGCVFCFILPACVYVSFELFGSVSALDWEAGRLPFAVCRLRLAAHGSRLAVCPCAVRWSARSSGPPILTKPSASAVGRRSLGMSLTASSFRLNVPHVLSHTHAPTWSSRPHPLHVPCGCVCGVCLSSLIFPPDLDICDWINH